MISSNGPALARLAELTVSQPHRAMSTRLINILIIVVDDDDDTVLANTHSAVSD